MVFNGPHNLWKNVTRILLSFEMKEFSRNQVAALAGDLSMLSSNSKISPQNENQRGYVKIAKRNYPLNCSEDQNPWLETRAEEYTLVKHNVLLTVIKGVEGCA